MKETTTIIKYLADNQLTEFGGSSCGKEYKGYWVRDYECPLFTYKMLSKELNISISELKKVMIEMRNNGLVELVTSFDDDNMLNGSSWCITEKGMIYAVDNNLTTEL